MTEPTAPSAPTFTRAEVDRLNAEYSERGWNIEWIEGDDFANLTNDIAGIQEEIHAKDDGFTYSKENHQNVYSNLEVAMSCIVEAAENA